MRPETLLFEPQPASRWWLSAIYARLLAVNEGVTLTNRGRGRPRVGVARRTQGLDGTKGGPHGIGSPNPFLLIVCNRMPKVDRGTYHLWAALRLLGFDEMVSRVCWAANEVQELAHTAEIVLAVGKQAGQRVGKLDLEEYVTAEHPETHRRRKLGPFEYADHLERAGLPRVAPVLLPPSGPVDEETGPELCRAMGVDASVTCNYPGLGWPPPDPIDARAAQADARRIILEASEEPHPLEGLARLTTVAAQSALEQLSEDVREGRVELEPEQAMQLGNLAVRLTDAKYRSRAGSDEAVAAGESAAHGD